MEQPKRVLHVASEASPFAKTGGLADVLGALPPALAKLGHQVAVLLPRYRGITLPRSRIWDALPVHVGPHVYLAGIDEVVRQGVRYLFVDIPALYDRDGFYYDASGDYPDNHLRFGALAQAALAVARSIFRPDIFHAHDWQTGLVPLYLGENFAGDPTFFDVRSIFTIHNLGYRGGFSIAALRDLSVDAAAATPSGFGMDGGVSFLRAGIVWSDAINTVSPTYAREIQSDALLHSHTEKLSGILNGIDYDEWNPATDWRIAARYSAADVSNKRECKLALLREMGLPVDARVPLIGITSRLAYQKGMELVVQIAPWLARHDAALVALGSGDATLETEFRGLASAYPDKFAVRIGFDEALSHRVEAGADMFLMPSRYEPCGLNQMYSLRYGTIPIVRSTGGLADTVDAQTGFVFEDYSAEALASAVGAALEAYRDREGWTKRMLAGMSRDFSWSASAREYDRLYQRVSPARG